MYQISYEFMLELVELYVEKVSLLSKYKGMNSQKGQEYFTAKTRLASLLRSLKEENHDVEKILDIIYDKLNLKYKYHKIRVHVDGAARNNDNKEIPNKSAVAFAVFGDGELLHKQGKYLGAEVGLPKLRNDGPDYESQKVSATNNVAEYVALIEALEYLIDNDITASHIEIVGDSEVVVKQVNRLHAARAAHLVRLRDCATQLMDEFENITLSHVPREENMIVDDLVNKILDEQEALNK